MQPPQPHQPNKEGPFFPRLQSGPITVKVRRVRLYDALALLTAMIVVALDQWTKASVVANLVENGPPVPLVGNYLTLYYIRNNGAAFSLFANSIVLIVFIVLASLAYTLAYRHELRSIKCLQ